MAIIIKNAEEVDGMRVACRLAGEVLDYVAPFVKPGVTTDELDKLCHDYMVNVQGCIPAPLNYAPPGYPPYPKSICASVNHQVCHGVPNDRPLKKGDIVNLDITTIKDGWHGDTSRMFFVGTPAPHAKRLVEVTRQCLEAAIALVKPGCKLGDIGHVIQTLAEKNHYSVVREYCGHGIGKVFHEEPQILHYGRPHTGLELKEGMVFTIEPMINAGKSHSKLKSDGWTVETKDGRLSAQWEHTMAVTTNGVEILTASPAGLF